jgi:hypothetical protein
MQPVYTPVVLRLRPAILYGDGTSALPVTRQLWLEIVPPDAADTLPHSSYLNVSGEGVLRLRLLSGPGRYTVYYRPDNPNARPLRTEQWIVPAPRPLQMARVTHSGGPDALPVAPGWALYEVLHVGHAGVWRLQDDSLLWLENPPPPGAVYSVHYVEGVTRERLLAYPTELSGGRAHRSHYR